MAVTTTNLLQGPADLFHGVFGATEPVDAGTAPAAAWSDLGGTDGGATLTVGQTYAPMTVDQVAMPVDARKTEESVSVATSLAEGTLDNLRRALNIAVAPTETEIEALGELFSNSSPLFSAVLLKGQKPGGGPRLVVVRRALSTENVAMAWTKADKTMIPVTFTGYFVSASVRALRIDDTVTP